MILPIWIWLLFGLVNSSLLAVESQRLCFSKLLPEPPQREYQNLMNESRDSMATQANGDIQFFLGRIKKLKDLQNQLPLRGLSNEELLQIAQEILDQYHRQDNVLPGLEPGNTIRSVQELIKLALREPVVVKLTESLQQIDLFKNKDKGFRLKIAQKILRQLDVEGRAPIDVSVTSLQTMSGTLKKYFEEVKSSMEFDESNTVKIVVENQIPGFGVQAPVANFLKSIANPIMGNEQMIGLWAKNPTLENFQKALNFYLEMRKHLSAKPIIGELDRRLKEGQIKINE